MAGRFTELINKVINYDLNPDGFLMHKVLLGGWEAWDTYEGNDRPNEPVCDGHIGFRDLNHPIVSDSEKWGRQDYRDQFCANNWPTSVWLIGRIIDRPTPRITNVISNNKKLGAA